MSFARLRNLFRTLFLLILAFVFLAGSVLLPASVRAEAAPDSHVFEASALEPFAAESKADGDTTGDGFFTLLWSTKSKVDGSSIIKAPISMKEPHQLSGCNFLAFHEAYRRSAGLNILPQWNFLQTKYAARASATPVTISRK